jgi:hypothetical protein
MASLDAHINARRGVGTLQAQTVNVAELSVGVRDSFRKAASVESARILSFSTSLAAILFCGAGIVVGIYYSSALIAIVNAASLIASYIFYKSTNFRLQALRDEALIRQERLASEIRIMRHSLLRAEEALENRMLPESSHAEVEQVLQEARFVLESIRDRKPRSDSPQEVQFLPDR